MPAFLTPQEVAGIFKLKRTRTVYEWIKEGLFPNTIVVKGSYRILQADVDRLIEQSKLHAPPAAAPLPPKRRVLSRGIS